MTANKHNYLDSVLDELEKKWPDNKTVNIVCHGHSVPSGYFATPFVDTFHAYPYVLHKEIKSRFPFAVLNVIVTAIGGETSVEGAARFESEVLNHNPSVITIDYALNDRKEGLEKAERAWRFMIEKSLAKKIKVILLTPSYEKSYYEKNEEWQLLEKHSAMVVRLASEYEVGLSDTFQKFHECIKNGEHIENLLSHRNHPSIKGHIIIANELASWFLAR